MTNALNLYRPYQAKLFYTLLFEQQVREKEELYNKLKKEVEEINNKYNDAYVNQLNAIEVKDDMSED